MSDINTEYLQRCIDTLERSWQMLKNAEEGSIDYELYRNSLVKSFEMTIEQSGKLLKKKITPYFPSKRAVDALTFKDIFRHANKHSLLTEEETLRWLEYRDNRNNTAVPSCAERTGMDGTICRRAERGGVSMHDYGQEFAEETLSLMDSFLKDARRLKEVIDDA